MDAEVCQRLLAELRERLEAIEALDAERARRIADMRQQIEAIETLMAGGDLDIEHAQLDLIAIVLVDGALRLAEQERIE